MTSGRDNLTQNGEPITPLPVHVAIIMDGNGRWAKRRGLTRLQGHKAGVDNVRPVVKAANDIGVKYLTIFGFSTENWTRPLEEVRGLMRLLQDRIDREADELHKNNVKIRHFGRMEELPGAIRKALNRAIELTAANTGMVLGFAFNYGGRVEILDAVRRMIADGVPPDKVNEKKFGAYLYTAGTPDVDLIIRTSGELRLSNFLMWQTAYAEYYFTDTLWPDFSVEELKKALLAYSQRKRRFGGL